MVDYEGAAVWKVHSDCSDKKRTLFVGKTLKTVIDNDPSKWIRSIVRHMTMSEFLIKQVVLFDI